ncbi:17374_t:CDS:2 [Funneliformis caledonium]|uniref:17374_t:CDS:1 n=1 Tax=Funneliformis caledonium TaxID=1117310 RepID=A0A9N9EWU2_9GLOM|nr:17374_t:CDS:2 [Funneliformis caledonium]
MYIVYEAIKSLNFTKEERNALCTFFINYPDKRTEVELILSTYEDEEVVTCLKNLLKSVAQISSFAEINVRMDKQQEFMSKIYQCIMEEKKMVAYSTINKENFNSFLKHINFNLSAVEFTGPLPKNNIEPYKWNDYTENDPNQLEFISQYLNQHFKPNLPKDYVVFNIANHKSFLDITTENSPFSFKIKGGTDYVVVEQKYIDNLIAKAGTQATIELKKQAIAEMVAADFLTNEEIKVIGVLTDLNERWHLFWLKEGKKIMMVKLSHCKKALDIISRIVKMMRVPGLPGGQRIKIYDNSYTQVDDIAPLEDFYEEMSKEYILRHKARKVIDLIRNNPLFSDVFSNSVIK